jgi:2-polyprenyl-3-methyl-5-hydroxy-6-metoxy-1,4-benzoquinol methylase
MTSLLRRTAQIISHLWPLTVGRRLWQANEKDYHLVLSKTQKIITGIYIILNDYSLGLFPPTFDDQSRAYDAEIACRFTMPGTTPMEFVDAELRKPFWNTKSAKIYLQNFVFLMETLEKLGIHPPHRLLELGCGTGWMAEFLALMKFNVVGTSLSSMDIKDANQRIASIQAKGIQSDLRFIVAPMESIADSIKDLSPFDSVFVFEALHHAYDWRHTIESTYLCLKPGGWFLICNEPNIIHTLVSYRGARLTNTHEIGLSRSSLVSHLKKVGFKQIRIVKNQLAFFTQTHWIVCQR